MEDPITNIRKEINSLTKALPRSALRRKCTIDEKLRVSLQTCPLKANEIKLEGLLPQLHNKEGRKGSMLNGLLFILNQLLATSSNGTSIGFMDFNDAYHLYCGFFTGVPPDKDTFRDSLLHPEHGLAVFIATLTPEKR